jgi:hypothetical protein
MSKGNTFESDLLRLIFNATPIANLADNAASAPLTNLYIALHTADPGEAGAQNTSECAYTGYTRMAVARTTGGFTVSGTNPTQVVPAATISFPTCTAGSETATHASIGTSLSGAGKILYSGPITPNIAIANGVTPQLTTASAAQED